MDDAPVMSKFADSYERVRLLGEGTYGVAFLVQSKTDAHVFRVEKEIRIGHLSDAEREAALAESEVLQKLSHSNIVAYVDSFVELARLHIVMEYANGGDLARRIRERQQGEGVFSEREVMFTLVQIALALKHVHSRNILHRDLKPLNIFLTKQGVVKLGDFGVAKILDNTQALGKTAIGTPSHMSPEVCNGEAYGVKSDIWALGVVAYELVSLRLPFQGSTMPVLVLRICTAEYARIPEEYSVELAKIIASLLQKDPVERAMLDTLFQLPLMLQYTQDLLSHTIQRGLGGCEGMLRPPDSGASARALLVSTRPKETSVRDGLQPHDHPSQVAAPHTMDHRGQLAQSLQGVTLSVQEDDDAQNGTSPAEGKVDATEDDLSVVQLLELEIARCDANEARKLLRSGLETHCDGERTDNQNLESGILTSPPSQTDAKSDIDAEPAAEQKKSAVCWLPAMESPKKAVKFVDSAGIESQSGLKTVRFDQAPGSVVLRRKAGLGVRRIKSLDSEVKQIRAEISMPPLTCRPHRGCNASAREAVLIRRGNIRSKSAAARGREDRGRRLRISQSSSRTRISGRESSDEQLLPFMVQEKTETRHLVRPPDAYEGSRQPWPRRYVQSRPCSASSERKRAEGEQPINVCTTPEVEVENFPTLLSPVLNRASQGGCPTSWPALHADQAVVQMQDALAGILKCCGVPIVERASLARRSRAEPVLLS